MTAAVEIRLADAVVVGPDDTLVVYVKSLLDHDEIELFAADLREMFGDRVFVIAGGDNLEVLFATLKPEGQPK